MSIRLHRPGALRDSVILMLRAAPAQGLSLADITVATGKPRQVMSVQLATYLQRGYVVRSGQRGTYRYHAGQVLLPHEAPDPPPRPRPPTRSRASQGYARPTARGIDAPVTLKRPGRDARTVIVPPDVKVTVCPSQRDTRFAPGPGAPGAGFVAEWARLRSGSQ